MLTLEEAGWPLGSFKAFSILNIFPIKVDMKNGKIQRQSNRVKIFIWKFLFNLGVFHWLYMFWRIVQSAILEPEKYFKWEHFNLHFASLWYNAVFYFTGFCLFVKNGEESVIVFNQLFVQPPDDPVQKMMGEKLQLESRRNGTGNEHRNQGITV